MFCSNCGSKVHDDASFCPQCGQHFPQNAPQQNPPDQHTYGAQPNMTPPPGTPIPPQSTPVPPAGGFVPPPSGFSQPGPGTPPNPGYPPSQGYPQNPGYPPVQPGPYGQPPRRKRSVSKILIAAAVLLCVLLIVVLVSVLRTPDPGNVILNDNTPKPTAAQPSASPTVISDNLRDNYTVIKGGGKDTVTVMIYMCGSNLESKDGSATADLKEILAANLGTNVNVVIQTGGCKDWKNNVVKDGDVQRWNVKNGDLAALSDLGKVDMLTPAALQDFITFSTQKFPANRYELIFWDHGGGSLYGYGDDELFPKSQLFLSDINDALKATNVKFDIVGFDACLMGSIETAYMLQPYADYLVASEESEPGKGWDYTPWLTALGQNPSMDPVALGTSIVDSFINQNSAKSTLSVVSLREIPMVYKALCTYMSGASSALKNQQFKMISTSLAKTKAFAKGEYDMIDIEDFTKHSNISGEEALIAALNSAIKYKNTCTVTGVYGLSLYFPYKDIDVYTYAKKIMSKFGFGGTVYKFYDSFVNILAGGQKSSDSRSLKENLTGQADATTDYSVYDWYDNSEINSYTYDNIDYTELKVVWDDKNGYYYLPLSSEDWDLITDVQQQILLDDGGGYIDLGSDQYYETDDKGNLVLNYGKDRSWVSIGGQTVCYYAEETVTTDKGTTFTGYVPAVLNGNTDIDIILEWDGEDSDGYIAGYRLTESDSSIGGAGTLGKGYLQFTKGDVIDFVCDYYTYDGKFDASYYFGETLKIGDTLPAVSYEDIGTGTVYECYMLVDVYQNYSWTQTVKFTD